MNKKLFAILFALFVFFPLYGQSDVNTPAPDTYEMKLVRIFGGKTPDYIFVVGTSGFKSVDGLKEFLGRLPAGSEVKWNPGCVRDGTEPLLSSEKEMNAFRKFLEEKKLKFNLIPGG